MMMNLKIDERTTYCHTITEYKVHAYKLLKSDKKAGNSCTGFGPSCLKLPFQGKNMDICGLACLIAAMIFSEYSEINTLLDKSQLLDKLSWVTELDK